MYASARHDQHSMLHRTGMELSTDRVALLFFSVQLFTVAVWKCSLVWMLRRFFDNDAATAFVVGLALGWKEHGDSGYLLLDLWIDHFFIFSPLM